MLLLLLALSNQQPVPGLAIEQRLARELSLAVGDTVQVSAESGAAERPMVVSAIYAARSDPATVLRREFQARFHLPDLALLLGNPDRIDRAGIALLPGVSPDSAADILDRLAVGFRAWPSASIASQSSRTFLVVSRFHRAIGVISIAASAIFLLCIMLLKVDERRLDAAVLRLIGISRKTVFAALVIEACLVALVGAAIGVLLSAVSSQVINAFYGARYETTLRFSLLTPGLVLFGSLLSLLLGVAVGSLAAARLVRSAPLALWRRG